MTSQLKQRILGLLGVSPAGPYLVRLHRLRRVISRLDERLRNDYLQKAVTPKLQVGGGWRLLDGWLNTDIEIIPGVMCMDATRRFPFADDIFYRVYTEHMIEHVSYHEGVCMLKECYRVLRVGGAIRVITPNLATIVGLYGHDLCAAQKAYVEWILQTFVRECPPNSVSVINTMFHEWGHQFIYDEKTLANSMHAVGFHSVRQCRLGESSFLDLQNMENEQRYPEGLLNFESIALEAVK
jgi:predicted SAM-dependent methyltransferase